jgi:hypothetical protein
MVRGVSIASLTSVAAVRDTEAPQKSDTGKATRAESASDVPASVTDLLVTQVPTELVAPYTAVSAALAGAVAKATSASPHPDQLAAWRWTAFVILILGIVGLTWEGKRRKAPGGPFPLLEVAGALIAGIGWAFALPASPLSPYLHGTAAQTATPLVIAFAAVVASSITAGALQSPRNSATEAAPPAANADIGVAKA